MSKLVGTRISDTLVPSDSRLTFPTHDSKYGKGGYRAVTTLVERNQIPVERLEVGAIVRVNENNTEYLVKSLTPTKQYNGVDSESNPVSYDVLDESCWSVHQLYDDSKIKNDLEYLDWEEYD